MTTAQEKATRVTLLALDVDSAIVKAADWQSSRPGGQGAVREACEFILNARGELAELEAQFS
jgi:3-deoxy-D-manno-octulosonate 8-phosphate phosphatase (KDO 8-P phosphatase)